jgi:hypothetical protein
MTMAAQEFPSLTAFKREPLPLPAGNLFRRLRAAHVIAKVARLPVATVAERHWPSDRLLRAAVAPAMTQVPGWAAELAPRMVADQLDALGPMSAGAELLKRGLVINFDGYGSATVPGFTASGANAGFVAEGAPIPVRQLPAAGPTMLPYKLAAIAVLTREMIESSNAEALINDALARSEGLALDAALFDASAATAARPAGLRNGIAALTPSNNADPYAAFLEDMASLANAVSTVAGNGPIVIIANAGRIATTQIRFVGQATNLIVLGSSALANDMIAVAPNALAAALSPEPDVETVSAGTLHMSDTPAPIVNGGAPASPGRSMFQTDSVAVKVRWPVSWALRSAAAVAWLTPTWK